MTTKRPLLCGKCYRNIVKDDDTGMPVCIGCKMSPSQCDCELLPENHRLPPRGPGP
jgi:hypothetical protein